MSALQIIIYICIGISLIAFILAFIGFIDEWREKGSSDWRYLFIGLLIIPIIIFGLFLNSWWIISNVVKAGGLKKYFQNRKAEKIEQKERKAEQEAYRKEYHRIEDLYKKGEIQRWELPRKLDGISRFEFKTDFIRDSGNRWQNLYYIENEYNECFNTFFQQHGHVVLKHGMRVLYLPQLIKDLANEDIVKYYCPDAIGNIQVNVPQIDSTFLLQQLCYPEDSKNIRHGVISFNGIGTNHGVDFAWSNYYPLEEGDEASIFEQINTIAKEQFERNSGGLYATVDKSSKGKKKSKKHADLYFNWEINDLLDEIKERVEKLEQLGLPRTLLQKIIQGEPKLSRLIVTKDYRIILPDYGDMEIKMEPLNKAVYLLFLKHPEGIIFKYLPDYREELTKIYASLKPYGINERVLKSIEDVTNPCLNSINEKCARIRGSFVSQFDDELAKNYYIYGHRGEPKKISLPQEMIEWEE